MKIGILTFHSQLNYGGVLQCWALQQALTRLGHEVVVLDHWMTPDNVHLREWLSALTKRKLANHLLMFLSCQGYAGRTLRILRTARFIKRLGLTPYHFHKWSEAPRELGVDGIVIGSDQIWHWGDGVFPDPAPYLLDGAPKIPAISYAASFGMHELPPESMPIYAKAFQRLSAISVRECEAIELIKKAGAKAYHVVDPTLLLARRDWQKAFGSEEKSNRVVCYFTRAVDVDKLIGEIEPWSRENNLTVDILAAGMLYGHTASSAFAGVKGRWWRHIKSRLGINRVRIQMGYGPKEFVRAFMKADSCITDSFHAMMFSYIYGLNLRVVSPAQYQKHGIGRFEWFVKENVRGPVMAEDLKTAMKSLVKDDRVTFDAVNIDRMRQRSIRWLEGALNAIQNNMLKNGIAQK